MRLSEGDGERKRERERERVGREEGEGVEHGGEGGRLSKKRIGRERENGVGA